MKKYLFLLLIFCTAFAKAQKVTLPAKTVITQPATAATPSAKILSRNASGELVETDKTVTQLDKQNLSEFVDDIGATEGVLPLSVFIDSSSGNDITGELEQISKPFQTINAALEAMPPTTGETYDVYLINGGSYNLTKQITIRNLNFIAYKTSVIDFSNILDLNNSVPLSPFVGSTAFKTLSFKNGNISLKNNTPNIRFGAASQQMILKGHINILEWEGSARGSGNGAFFIDGGTDVIINNLKVVGVGEFLDGDSNGTPNEIYLEINELTFIDNRSWAVGLIATFNIKKITQSDNTSAITYTLRSRYEDSSCVFIIGDVDINGKTAISAKEIIFNESNYSDTATTTLSGKVSGNIISNNYQGSGSKANTLILDGFSGKLVNMGLNNGNPIIRNSSIETNGSLFTGSQFTDNNITFEGSSSIFQNNLNSNLFLTYSYGNLSYPNNMHLIIKGTLKSNVLDYGYNVTYETPTATFKEKLGEIVIRSKNDLVNKNLDPFAKYTIDGDIVLTANDSIIIPFIASRPNLTLGGYGLEQSSITKTGGGPIFVSAAGGSGGLQMEGIKLKCTGCPVFDLTDATGFNAVELVKVNIEDSGSIGTLDGYRQGLWSNIGVFNVSDGLTFEGGWLGGFRSQNVIVRNLEGATGSLFKKGTSLTFGSRFYTDANIDLPTGWSIADFDNTNFTNPNTFQVQNAIITRAGVSDPTDTGYFPNINEENTASEFSGNTGVPNSALNFFKLKSTNGTVYQLGVDNAGNLTTTQI